MDLIDTEEIRVWETSANTKPSFSSNIKLKIILMFLSFLFFLYLVNQGIDLKYIGWLLHRWGFAERI